MQYIWAPVIHVLIVLAVMSYVRTYCIRLSERNLGSTGMYPHIYTVDYIIDKLVYNHNVKNKDSIMTIGMS